MGLVQRELEKAGLATVALSMIPDFTAKVGAPRVAAVAYPMSRPLGRVGDADGQRAVLRATLGVLESATAPGTVVELPFVWPQSPAEARKEHRAPPPPIAELLRKKPWLLPRLYAGDIPHDER